MSETGVEGLIASIEELGLIKDEIIVRKIKRSGKLVLIAGAHRTEAARRKGILVPAKIYACNDDWAKLMEAHDNLANSELTALDLSIFLNAHQEVYHKLYPETRPGVAGANAKHGLQRNSSSFAEMVAEARGVTPRQVRKIIAAGASLSAQEVETLRAAKSPVTLKDMQDLSKIGDANERGFVCQALLAGDTRNVSAARKIFNAGGAVAKPPRDHVDESFKAILQAWRRAPARARSRFVDDCKSELIELMGGGNAEA